MVWDWALEIWGPKTSGIKKDVQFTLVITGVVMNNPTTGQNFQIGFTPTSDLNNIVEFGLLQDIRHSNGWVTQKPLQVISVVSSSNNIRSFTDLAINFKIPITTGGDVLTGDFVSVTLSH
jgi:DNA mismatch repair protein MutH